MRGSIKSMQNKCLIIILINTLAMLWSSRLWYVAAKNRMNCFSVEMTLFDMNALTLIGMTALKVTSSRWYTWMLQTTHDTQKYA